MLSAASCILHTFTRTSDHCLRNPINTILSQLSYATEITETAGESDWETASNDSNKSSLAPAQDIFDSPENRTFYLPSPHKVLDSTQLQIRLLEFLSSNDDGVLSFTLLDNCYLDSVHLAYIAL
jgi:hypothetical protein